MSNAQEFESWLSTATLPEEHNNNWPIFGFQAAYLAGRNAGLEKGAEIAENEYVKIVDMISRGKGEYGTKTYVRDALWDSWIGARGSASSIEAAIRKEME